jgi:predicted RNA-binding Zn ribbon-like protein
MGDAKIHMMKASGPSFLFVADAIGLDFVNALLHPANGNGGAIGDGGTFLRWIAEAGLVPNHTLEALRTSASPGEIDAVAAEARALGEWFRGFVQEYKGAPFPASAVDRLQPLNRILQRDTLIRKIGVRDTLEDRIAGSGLQWIDERAYKSPDMLLLPLAQAMAELICVEEFGNVQRCEGAGCGLLFLDRTRGRARRWCSMVACGSRATRAARSSARDP